MHKRRSLALGLFALFALAFALVLVGCGSSAPSDSTPADEPAADAGSAEPAAEGDYSTGIHHARIVVRDYGTIEVELNAVIAPITVQNFADLANAGFYDGLTFHRIISGFMIQGGSSTGTGMPGDEPTIVGEFEANGHPNTIAHVRGVISMARSQDYDSASTQFFIMHEDAPSLDGQYAAFGRVTSGMDVVDAIAENTPVQDDNGTVAAEDQPVIETIEMID